MCHALQTIPVYIVNVFKSSLAMYLFREHKSKLLIIATPVVANNPKYFLSSHIQIFPIFPTTIENRTHLRLLLFPCSLQIKYLVTISVYVFGENNQGKGRNVDSSRDFCAQKFLLQSV